MPIRILCDRRQWKHLHSANDNLADPTYCVPSKIDLLMGIAAHADIVLSGVVEGRRHQSIAQYTELGESRSMAERRYKALQTRFETNTQMKLQYDCY